MTVIARAVRQEVAPRYKALRRAIGKKLKRARTVDGYDAKVGADVGKKKPPKRGL